VWKLDRLGRDLRHLVNTVHDLTERGIGLKVLTGQGDCGNVLGGLPGDEPLGRELLLQVPASAQGVREYGRTGTEQDDRRGFGDRTPQSGRGRQVIQGSWDDRLRCE
jgi:hypothetical protein